MKNRFEFQGELTRVERFTTNKNKTILTLIFETGGQWSQTIPIKVFGRLVDRSSEWKEGATLNITGKLGGRDWNGRVYPDIVAESVEVVGQRELPVGNPPPSPAPGDDDIPF